jgi:phosphatidylglycerol:prolipoprotein diacylglycerol transferase
MWPTLHLLGVTVQTYPLALLLGVMAGLWLAARSAKKLGIDGERVYNLVFYALVASALGARLAYVIGHWDAYRENLLSIVSLTPMALSWPEGALIGGVVAVLYGRRHRLPAGTTLDALAPGLTLALAIERLGAFLSGSSFGEPTLLPWGVQLWSEVRHPVQLYEMAALLAILGILLWRRDQRPFGGHLFVLFVILYASSRLFLEAFRAQPVLLPGGVRGVQVGALAVTIGALWYLYRRRFSFADAAGSAGLGESNGDAPQ